MTNAAKQTSDDRPGSTDQQPLGPLTSNAVRLSPREWLIAWTIVLAVMMGTPAVWSKLEPFRVGADYRVPYSHSEDYWLYRRLVQNAVEQQRVLVIGDSVVWGEYVSGRQTLTHFLNEEAGAVTFENGGVNAIHPLALQGLVRDYAGDLTDRPVILHLNLLWMSAPERDLQIDQEIAFNHPQLIPQLVPSIPAYQAPRTERLGILVDRVVPYRSWVAHMRISHFESLDVHSWSLDNANENPFSRIHFQLPQPSDTLRHNQISWSERGIVPQDFAWVDLDGSLQWQAFRQTIEKLSRRGNRVFVLVGPFNVHLLQDASRERYLQLLGGVQDWLERHHAAFLVPDVLPSEQYADASHPLGPGYRRLARAVFADERFQQWLHAALTGQSSANQTLIATSRVGRHTPGRPR